MADTNAKKDDNRPETATDSAQEQATDGKQPILDYVCHPAKRDMRITVLATFFLIVCVVLVWLISFSPFLTALAVLILFGSLGGFYFPTRYIFFDDHIEIKTMIQTLRKNWSQFRSYYPDKNGVLLSPFGRPTRLENFRGQYIKFAGNREQVMKLVRSKIDFEEDL